MGCQSVSFLFVFLIFFFFFLSPFLTGDMLFLGLLVGMTITCGQSSSRGGIHCGAIRREGGGGGGGGVLGSSAGPGFAGYLWKRQRSTRTMREKGGLISYLLHPEVFKSLKL